MNRKIGGENPIRFGGLNTAQKKISDKRKFRQMFNSKGIFFVAFVLYVNMEDN